MSTTYNTVWLIDDNEIDNFINKKILLKCNFAKNVKEFSSATVAERQIDELTANSEAEIPDFVFLDLNMPVYSGIDFLNRCEQKLLGLNPDIKLAILTSSINPSDEFNASSFSIFKLYIFKPLDEEVLKKL